MLPGYESAYEAVVCDSLTLRLAFKNVATTSGKFTLIPRQKVFNSDSA